MEEIQQTKPVVKKIAENMQMYANPLPGYING